APGEAASRVPPAILGDSDIEQRSGGVRRETSRSHNRAADAILITCRFGARPHLANCWPPVPTCLTAVPVAPSRTHTRSHRSLGLAIASCRSRSIMIAAPLLVLAMFVTTPVTSDGSSSSAEKVRGSHVRTLDSRVREWIRVGCAESRTFAELVDR